MSIKYEIVTNKSHGKSGENLLLECLLIVDVTIIRGS